LLANQVTELIEQMKAIDEIRVQVGGNEAIKQRVEEHEQLMITVPRIAINVDALADHVIGPKVPDPLNPGQFRINGNGEFMREPKGRFRAFVLDSARTAATVVVAILGYLQVTQ
jgi:hypothetical protein